MKVKVLVLGGGINGVGVLHDLASRGIRELLLLEKTTLGAGTSSRSTKLIHGGLRYLEHITQYSLVMESLRERAFLLKNLPDLVHPLELLFPVYRQGGLPWWKIKAGLCLYEALSGSRRLEVHRFLSPKDLTEKMPDLNMQNLSGAYGFWDGQTDDLGLVHRVAQSAKFLGAKIEERMEVLRILPALEESAGWIIEVKDHKTNLIAKIHAEHVVNATGPWANRLLERSGMKPTHEAINNQGSHLLFKDMGLKAGLYLPSLTDHRFVFLLPWKGYTMIGTTEALYEDDPDHITPSQEEVTYLLKMGSTYFKTPFLEKDILMSFAGLRWLAVERGRGGQISANSREHLIGRIYTKKPGVLMTLYGGKLTSYRSLSEAIGDELMGALGGVFVPSRTMDRAFWSRETGLFPSVEDRFR